MGTNDTINVEKDSYTQQLIARSFTTENVIPGSSNPYTWISSPWVMGIFYIPLGT